MAVALQFATRIGTFLPVLAQKSLLYSASKILFCIVSTCVSLCVTEQQTDIPIALFRIVISLYTFDTRQLNKPVNVHMDHVAAVTSVEYAPTGKEFVSGSYDKTIRIFECDHGHSRDVYHTKRMQRLTCVHWTLDNKFIISGSDEMNIRIWKARASEKLGPLRPKERNALQYAEALKSKFASHPEVKRIKRHRHVPKHVYNAQRELRTIKEKEKRKEANKRAHLRKGAVPHVPERQKHIIKEVQ